MEELKAGRNGSFAQVGWMAEWMMENFFVLRSSPLRLMTWQWICDGCRLLVNPRSQVISARSNPALILYLHPVFS